jgi:hypothetical protein
VGSKWIIQLLIVGLFIIHSCLKMNSEKNINVKLEAAGGFVKTGYMQTKKS